MVAKGGTAARKQGYYDFVYQPLVGAADGIVTGVLQQGIDVTARVRGGAIALRESERQFRTLADAIPTLAWTARADGHIDWYNARWYEYTGTTPSEMEGWGWQSVQHPDELPRVLEQWQAGIESGRRWR